MKEIERLESGYKHTVSRILTAETAVDIPKRLVRQDILKKLFGESFYAGKAAYEIAACASGMSLEKTSFSITFIVADDFALEKATNILRVDAKPSSLIKNLNELLVIQEEVEAVNEKNLLDVCKLFNGMKTAFLIHEDRTIHSVKRLKIDGLNSYNPLDIFRYISQHTGANVVVGRPETEKTQRHVEVYRNGGLSFEEVYLRKAKKLYFRDVKETSEDLSSELKRKGIERQVFEELLEIAIEMSPFNGASFIIGNYSKLFNKSTSMSKIKNIGNIEFSSLNELTTDDIIYYSSLDGATIVDKTGGSIAFNRQLHPTSQDGTVLTCRGTRHYTASNITKDFEDSIALVVSGDYGLLTIFNGGEPLEF